MKVRQNLRIFITLTLSSLVLSMIVAYSLLVCYSLFSTLQEAASYDLELLARDFADEYITNTMIQLPQNKYLSTYIDLKDIPLFLKNTFDFDTFAHGKLMVETLVNPQAESQEVLAFSMAYELHDGKRLYLIQMYSNDDDIPGSFSNISKSVYTTLVLGIGFILLVGILLSFFFNRISKSIQNLMEWAYNLRSDNVAKEPPDFQFSEVNQLAEMLKGAVSDAHEALNREHHFLQNASHELRTPIAVIRSNLDLLDKIHGGGTGKEIIPYQRIRRAVNNMQNQTETLLWLSRKSETMPPPEEIDVVQMVEATIRENEYLLLGKNVSHELRAESCNVTLPRIAFGIVLNNLIRNAFQHAYQGNIRILVTSSFISVTNLLPRGEETAQNDIIGFGLGFRLVEQICGKLNLQCSTTIDQGKHISVVTFP